MNRKRKNEQGFTLIELLVAVIVLAIIVVMAIPQISNLIDSNNDAKYDAYAGTIETSAKLYTDSYNEDMFGENQSGCYDVKFHQMEEKNLLEDIKINNVTCAGGEEKKTFARVYKSGSHYKYKVSILCTNKNSETTVLYSDLIEEELERECDGKTTDEEGPKITISPNGLNWTTGTGKKTIVTITDPYGLLENVKIKYAWTTTPNNIPDSAWTSKNFGNVRYVEEAKLTLTVPQGKTGVYYLVIQPESVRDANGNYYSGGTLISEPFKLDNTPPRITGTTNSSNGAWTNSDVTVTVSSTDTGGGVKQTYYGYSSTKSSITKKDWTSTTSNTVTKIFDDEMEKTVYVMAEDAAGNKSDVVTVGDVKIDKSEPTCTAVATGTKGTNSWWKSNATITLTTSDTGGSTLSGYNLTTSATPSYNGTTKTQTQTNTTGTTWYGYVKDAAGNVGTCNTGTVKVDTTAPTCTINATGTTGENGWFRGNATVTLSPNDTGGSTLDSKDLTTSTTASYKGTTSATQTNTAGTTWYGYVKDKAGNVGSCSKQVKVDTTAPTCSISLSGTKNGSYYASKVTVSLNKNDSGGSTLGSYGLTTSSSATYNSTATATQSTTSGITWYGYVKDKAGNTGKCNSGSFVVKLRTVPEFTYSGSYQIVDDNDNVISDPNNYNGNWKIRFLSSGTFKITNLHGAANGIDVFVVGGGGNGGNAWGSQAGRHGYASGGAGGGGGYNKLSKGVSVSLNSYKITIGAARQSSSGFGVTASAGGNGASQTKFDTAVNGGASNSGTGGIGNCNSEKSGNGGSGVCEFKDCTFSSKRYGGGGGGGHGENGAVTESRGWQVGAGIVGSGGAGGGGEGNNTRRNSNSQYNGQANTGGGGGGSSWIWTKYRACVSNSGCNCWSSDGCYGVSGYRTAAGTGGSGIVIIRNKR